MIYLKNSVGLEIRREDLVLTCLSSNFSGGVFTHFKRIAGYKTRERAELRNEIEHFFRTRKLGRDNVVLGIPRSDALIRHLDFPREVEDNLRQVVLYQVQSFEPSEDEKSYHDYVLMNPRQSGRLQVLLVMVRKGTLDAHLQLVRELGIAPVGVTVGSIALANLFVETLPDAAEKVFVLADLKGDGLEIIALRSGSLLYSHEAALGEGQGWKELVLGQLELVAARIRLAPDDTIEELVLCGEQADVVLQELREAVPDSRRIGSQLRFEMALAEHAHLDEAATSLGLAYAGIARRVPLDLNLLPAELRVQQARSAYVPSIVLGVVALGLVGGFAFRQMAQEQIMMRELDDQLRGLQAPVTRIKALKTQADALEKKIKYVEQTLRPCDMNLEILQELTALLPADTFLSMYRNADGTVTLTGSSSRAEELISKLEQSPLLKNVQQRGTVFKDAQTGKDRFNFEAKVERCQ